MGRAGTPSFITELPLRITPAQERVLLVRLEAARQVYNACLGEALRRLALLRQSRAYRKARSLPRREKGSPEAKARALAFREAAAAAGFSEYALHRWATCFRGTWLRQHLDSNTVQKLATRAFLAVREHALGRRGRPRFKGRNQFDSVEGKSNKSGIRWRDGRVEWSGLELEAIIDDRDPVVQHGLGCRVKYVRLVRRKIGQKNRFYAQLVCEGRPLRKERNCTGRGVVGLDIGPSTVAIVTPEAGHASLQLFCTGLEPRQREIRRLQRKIDRQRRANNPQNYNPDGTVKKGARSWRRSARQKRVEAKLAELHRKQAAHRRSLHGQLANSILRLGDVVRLEKLSYRALQQSFGRSVGMRAPGKLVELLKRKAESAGASVEEFPATANRLSQVCHNCGSVVAKPLSCRWHVCECGVRAQRDLYSAFLASCVEGGRLDAGRARELWPGVDALLQAASSLAKQPASSGHMPASFGLWPESEPVAWKAGANAAEVRDAVPVGGEPGRGCWTTRTPCL